MIPYIYTIQLISKLLSKTLVDVSDISKIVGPSPLRSQLIRNHDRKNECFLTTFWEKMVCFTKLTPRTPPSVIHGWKATDLLFQMVKTKRKKNHPVKRQIFDDAPGQTFYMISKLVLLRNLMKGWQNLSCNIGRTTCQMFVACFCSAFLHCVLLYWVVFLQCALQMTLVRSQLPYWSQFFC